MKMRDLGDGTVEIIESVEEINARYVDLGMKPPIIIIRRSLNPESDIMIKTKCLKTFTKDLTK